MMLEQIKAMDQAYYMNTFGERTPVCFTHGSGLELYATDGKKYLDFFAGIAVSGLGHSHPKFTDAICEQVKKVVHTSSLYYIKNQATLAKELAERSCADKIFFANTGAEANEGALKLAKMFFYKQNKPRYKFVTLENSFHGRTLATVAATGQTKYQKPYKPLMPEFVHVPVNDCKALEEAMDEETCGLILELIQGESGVHPLNEDFIALAKSLCEKTGALLLVDEVQTGMGRTGTLFAHQGCGIEPDIFTLAKALGNGIPIGAVCAKDFVAKAFEPGDHGTTFGGNPLATCAGLTVLRIFDEENLIENAKNMGIYFMQKINDLNSPKIQEVRGKGLMIGIEFKEEIAKDVNKSLFAAGYLTGAVGTKILRLLPPLIINKDQIDGFVDELEKIIQ